jgi:hypothetical protein
LLAETTGERPGCHPGNDPLEDSGPAVSGYRMESNDRKNAAIAGRLAASPLPSACHFASPREN